jgi:glutamyl-tRNA reductase
MERVMTTFCCVGVSHRQAPIAQRERLAIPADQLPARLQELHALPGVREALIVSTCNRLEIFATVDSPQIASDILETLDPVAAPLATCRFDESALRHLFRVAASLDSMMVGEAQILGQVKEAAAQALRAGSLGAELQRYVASACGAAKRVRTETQLAHGTVSLSSVAVELASKLLGDLSGRAILLLGAGEMAQLAARELRAQGAREMLVANRSFARAEELAREIEGIPVSLEELPELLQRVDVVVCSTGADRYVISRDQVERALPARRYRPLFLVDLSLPRNVEPSANTLENVYVYDLDDLERIAAQNRNLREAQVGRAEEIVDEELRALLAQRHERKAVPVLAKLRAKAESLARAEVERTLASLQELDEKERCKVRALAAAIVNKLLHEPTARLRAEAGAGPLALAAMNLFGLEEQPERRSAPVLSLVSNG